ncbi:OstA family protein [Rippkaea orientalis PCC 8801]|uniref:OstA family protein n=1 Tax=Rippkaea orientalis (strain PCC 8801 / RF-1) TaxID=41431 RepID=B7K005_RIPO1|nr:LptA/OstA family protein [Rippkaea orientalis]ACK66152.1 OstA family protein [Rippkaea orientalis PCC 8801]
MLSIPVLIVKNSWRSLGAIIALTAGVIALKGILPIAQAQTPPSNSPLTVRSDIQEANSETGVVTARGNVQVFYPSRDIQGTAAQAQYFSRERRLVMTGDVFVLQEGNTMRAEIMTYLIDEGRFIATPESAKQVESIYLVTETEDTSPQPASVAPAPPLSPVPPLTLPPLNPNP